MKATAALIARGRYLGDAMSCNPLTEACRAQGTAPTGQVRQDQNRADFLEFLYYADERDNPEHPLANTYTGLFQDYCYLVGEAVLASLTAGWHETEIKGLADALVGAAIDVAAPA